MSLATDQLSDTRLLSPAAVYFMSLREPVMDYWEREVRARVPGANALLSPILTNTLPAFFDNIAEALSPDHPRHHATSGSNSAAAHGGERARMTPFGPDQVVHEYQIFREAIAAVVRGGPPLTESDWLIIDRSINTATRESVRAFTAIHEELRHRVAAALSHDMRTPLAVIANGAQLIAIALNMSTARSTALRIGANARRLGEMMAELLEALTVESSARVPLHLVQFDVRELAAEVRDDYAQRCDTAVTFAVEGDSLTGYWCRDALRRALENLVNNAIKYGSGGQVTIRVAHTRGRLMLSVHNHGAPIPPEEHDRIFNYLRRAAGGLSEGWGIGLPYVRLVAESHGGSAEVDSSAATGTTFLIDLPVDCRPFVADAGS